MSEFATTYRTATCGELAPSHAGQSVTLSGFVDSRTEARLDLRDRYGIARCFLPREAKTALREKWETVGSEYVVRLTGTVAARPKLSPTDPGDQVDVNVDGLEVLGNAEPLPPEITSGSTELDDRLRYRHLDLRRRVMQDRLTFRSKFLFEVRSLLQSRGFTEIETPLLAKWTPEATQSFVVPAGGGRAFALPGTPQPYKQLLMAGGVDRYFQLARCFRREETLTPEKQLEFTTLDVEMAFADEKDIFETIDALVAHVWAKALGVTVPTPLPRLTYQESMLRYGTDAPDLRFAMEITDLTLFASQAASPSFRENAGVRAIRAEGAAEIIGDNELNAIAAKGAKIGGATVGWVKIGANRQLRGPGAKLFAANDHHDLFKIVPAMPGDVVVLIITKSRDAANKPAGAVRKALGKALAASAMTDQPAFVIVTQFPFFEYNPDDEAWVPCRHPFTQPMAEDLGYLDTDKTRLRTKAYDLVLNGVELGAGSIRNHDLGIQRRILEMFEYKPQEIEARFGAILDAFRFGVPPHGGFALGMDRLVAMVQGLEGIEDAIAFPKNRDGEDPLFGAPAAIDPDVIANMLGAGAAV